MISPARRREAVWHVQEALEVSERRACRVIGQSRTTQRSYQRGPDDKKRLPHRVVELAGEYGRYGYQRVTAMLQNDG